jgi:saccharopine dehydrogenase-like NADP-dependent oxidoreductase
VGSCDVVVRYVSSNFHADDSLLPAPMHPLVARHCIDLGKHLVTASYVSPEMKALDKE